MSQLRAYVTASLLMLIVVEMLLRDQYRKCS